MKFAPENVKNIVKSIPKRNIEVAKLSDEAILLAEHYINEKILTKKSQADTQHIALPQFKE